MNERDDLDRLLTAWFAVDAPMREPEPLLGQVLARTVRTRRRPAWRIPERWIPMSTISTRLAATSRFPWRTVGAVALLILALIAGVWAIAGRTKPLPAPFGPAHNGQIAFGDQGDIVALDPATGQRTVLIGGPAEDGLPWFSPDGARFVFVRGDPGDHAELWAADADGANPVRLAAVMKIGWVEWSPQSDVIAMTNDVDRSVITMVRADGSGTTVVDTDLAVAENPVWRPIDGRQLAFRGQDMNGTWGLYLMDRDGSNITHLDLDAGFRLDEFYTINSDYYFQSAAWSPDGSRLMFHTLEPAPGAPAGPGFRIHIADIDAVGAVVAERRLEFDLQTDDEFNATWLPAGDGFVFSTIEGAEHRLWTGDPGGVGPARNLGPVAADWIGFQVSPDGREVISSLKATSTADTTVQVTELSSGATSPLTIHDGYAWQRTAQ
jgi:Tol biopolymer transport system component